eukprot:XP_001692295.1 predicted protein [Chlamydomonas reinhardtii]
MLLQPGQPLTHYQAGSKGPLPVITDDDELLNVEASVVSGPSTPHELDSPASVVRGGPAGARPWSFIEPHHTGGLTPAGKGALGVYPPLPPLDPRPTSSEKQLRLQPFSSAMGLPDDAPLMALGAGSGTGAVGAGAGRGSRRGSSGPQGFVASANAAAAAAAATASERLLAAGTRTPLLPSSSLLALAASGATATGAAGVGATGGARAAPRKARTSAGSPAIVPSGPVQLAPFAAVPEAGAAGAGAVAIGAERRGRSFGRSLSPGAEASEIMFGHGARGAAPQPLGEGEVPPLPEVVVRVPRWLKPSAFQITEKPRSGRLQELVDLMAAVTAPTIFDLGGLEFSGAVVPPPPPQGPQLAGHAHSSTSFYTASGMDSETSSPQPQRSRALFMNPDGVGSVSIGRGGSAANAAAGGSRYRRHSGAIAPGRDQVIAVPPGQYITIYNATLLLTAEQYIMLALCISAGGGATVQYCTTGAVCAAGPRSALSMEHSSVDGGAAGCVSALHGARVYDSELYNNMYCGLEAEGRGSWLEAVGARLIRNEAQLVDGAGGALTKVTSTGNGRDGIALEGGGTAARLVKCESRENRESGLCVTGGAAASMSGCRLSANQHDGLAVGGLGSLALADGCAFLGNTAKGAVVCMGGAAELGPGCSLHGNGSRSVQVSDEGSRLVLARGTSTDRPPVATNGGQLVRM